VSGDSADLISHAQFAPGTATLVLGRRGLLLLPAATAMPAELVPVVLEGRPGFAVDVAHRIVGDQTRSPFAVVEVDADPSLGATVLVRGEVGLVALHDDGLTRLDGSDFATWREHRLPRGTRALVVGEPASLEYTATAPSVLPVASARIPLGPGSPADPILTAPGAGTADPRPLWTPAPEAPGTMPPVAPSSILEPTSMVTPPGMGTPAAATAVEEQATKPEAGAASSRSEGPNVDDSVGAFGLLIAGPVVHPPADPPPRAPGGPAEPSADGTTPVAEPARTPYDFSGRPSSPFATSGATPVAAHAAEADPSQPEEFRTTAIGSLREQLAAERQGASPPEVGDDLGHTIARPAGFGPKAEASPANRAAASTVRAKTCRCGLACDPAGDRCPSCGASLSGRPLVTGPPPVVGRLRFDDGQEVTLLGPLTLGRKPPSSRTVSGLVATPVALDDPEQRVSLFHLEVRVEEWTVSIVDYGSTNHTWATLPDQSPVRLRANQPFTIVPGTIVDLAGQRTFTYVGGPG